MYNMFRPTVRRRETAMSDTTDDTEQTLEQKFIYETTLHGIPQFWDNKRPIWIRVFWVFAFLACLCTSLWLIWLRIAEFREYEATTKITLEYDDELDFPAITICNFNRYRASRVTPQEWVYLEYALFAEDYDYDSYEDDGKFEQSSFDYDALFENSTFSFSEFTRRTGFVLTQDTLLQCKWKGRPCSAENFTHQFTAYGNCWTFNKGKDRFGNGQEILRENQPGSGNGLYMVIDIQQDEYTETINGNTQAGLKVLAHDHEEPPMMDALGSAVSPGFYAYFALRKHEYFNLQRPWGYCEPNKDLEFYRAYTISGCLIECKLKYLEEECGCRPVRYPGNAEECTPYQSANCVRDVLSRIKAGTLGPCECPIPCYFTAYTTALSYGAFPSQSVAAHTEELFNISTEYQKNNLIVLDIFYEELNYQYFEQQKAMTVSSLISDIGGNLGLFIGASILTFAEFIDYVSRKIFGVCNKNTPTNKVTEAKGKENGHKLQDIHL